MSLPAGLAAGGAAPGAAAKPRKRGGGGGSSAASGDSLTSPMQGTIVKVAVEDGATVEAGDLVVVLEAMKMEQPISAHKAGTIPGCPPRWARRHERRGHLHDRRRRRVGAAAGLSRRANQAPDVVAQCRVPVANGTDCPVASPSRRRSGSRTAPSRHRSPTRRAHRPTDHVRAGRGAPVDRAALEGLCGTAGHQEFRGDGRTERGQASGAGRRRPADCR